MDIKSNCGWPAEELSNFASHPFALDGVRIASMEGFLQSLKFSDQKIQIEVCKLVGYKAKAAGRHQDWRQSQTLYWNGTAFNRHGELYQTLLDRAYQAMFEQNEKFRNCLAATGSETLTHSIGRTNASETVLTQREFCSRLLNLRDGLFTK
jgi:predicted NAD-dependent protein-ADP-ribosyltransferase YbiA (DUF1768 family)